jgi:hypothetical protein
VRSARSKLGAERREPCAVEHRARSSTSPQRFDKWRYSPCSTVSAQTPRQNFCGELLVPDGVFVDDETD